MKSRRKIVLGLILIPTISLGFLFFGIIGVTSPSYIRHQKWEGHTLYILTHSDPRNPWHEQKGYERAEIRTTTATEFSKRLLWGLPGALVYAALLATLPKIQCVKNRFVDNLDVIAFTFVLPIHTFIGASAYVGIYIP